MKLPPPPNEVYRNGGVISVSPSKKFALVQVDGGTHSAFITNPEWDLNRGQVVVLHLSEDKEPQIVSCFPAREYGPIPSEKLPPEPTDYNK